MSVTCISSGRLCQEWQKYFFLLISPKYYCYFQQGNTALHIAVIGNYKELASSLVDAKAEIDLPNHVSIYRICKYIVINIIYNYLVYCYICKSAWLLLCFLEIVETNGNCKDIHTTA